MTTVDSVEVTEYAEQALEFLRCAHAYLANGDLHQASEKSWSAASRMAEAVAAANGWDYGRHSDFSCVIDAAWRLSQDDRIRQHRAAPNDLHGNFYMRARFLDAEVIAWDLDEVEELVSALAPLTRPAPDNEPQP